MAFEIIRKVIIKGFHIIFQLVYHDNGIRAGFMFHRMLHNKSHECSATESKPLDSVKLYAIRELVIFWISKYFIHLKKFL